MARRRPSSIDRLPADILEQLNALLRDPRVSQLQVVSDINSVLSDVGNDARITKSSLNRYAQKMATVGERLQQSRQLAEVWIGKLGAQPQGQVGKLVNEILRTLSFDLSMQLHDGFDELEPDEIPGVVKMVKELSIAAHRLEQAATENVERDAEIRRQAQEEAATIAAKVAKSGGLSEASVQELRSAILGIRK